MAAVAANKISIGTTIVIVITVVCVTSGQGTVEEVNSLAYPIEESGRVIKRYPQHLDPTMLRFWIQVGECPESIDGGKQFYCPSLTDDRKQVCIDDHHLCDGVKNCPNAEDEDKHYCLFYKALKSQVELLERGLANFNKIAQEMPVRRFANPIGIYKQN